MAIGLVIRIPGGTTEQYDAVLEGLTEGGASPWGEGQLAHYAGPSGDDAIVVDVWESREHFDRFMNGRLGAQLGIVGVPQPEITEFQVHNQM